MQIWEWHNEIPRNIAFAVGFRWSTMASEGVPAASGLADAKTNNPYRFDDLLGKNSVCVRGSRSANSFCDECLN